MARWKLWTPLVAAVLLSVRQVVAGATFVMAKKEDWSVTGPFSGGLLHHYSQYGAIDVHEHEVSFCRREPNQAGAIWTKTPSQFIDWQFTARIRFRGGAEGGNGMAFWYTKEGHSTGPVMGGPDKWHGLALLIDTYDDDHRGNNPAIVAIMNDGSFEYKPYQDGEGQYFGGCLRNVRNLEHPFGLRVSHMKQLLRVEVDDKGEGKEWMGCFEKQGISMPAGSYFGISASTNNHPDQMELLEFSVSSAESIEKEQHTEKDKMTHERHAATSSFDAEALGKFVEAAVQRQLMSSQQAPNERLRHIELTLGPLSDAVVQMGKSLNALEEHLHQHGSVVAPQQHAHAAQHGDPTHLELQNSLGELKARMENLHNMIAEHSYATMQSASSGGGSGKWWAWFVVAQVVFLVLFVIIKRKIDSRGKKLL